MCEIYIADWFSKRESIGYFYARIFKNRQQISNHTGRKGAEIYAIYRTGSRAGGKADGLVDVFEKL